MPTTVIRTKRRRRVKPIGTFHERLQKAAEEAREAARRLPACNEREALLEKVRQLETAVHVNEVLATPLRAALNQASGASQAKRALGPDPRMGSREEKHVKMR